MLLRVPNRVRMFGINGIWLQGDVRAIVPQGWGGIKHLPLLAVPFSCGRQMRNEGVSPLIDLGCHAAKRGDGARERTVCIFSRAAPGLSAETLGVGRDDPRDEEGGYAAFDAG